MVGKGKSEDDGRAVAQDDSLNLAARYKTTGSSRQFTAPRSGGQTQVPKTKAVFRTSKKNGAVVRTGHESSDHRGTGDSLSRSTRRVPYHPPHTTPKEGMK